MFRTIGGLFVPWTFRTMDFSYHLWTFHTVRTTDFFVPSSDFSCPGLYPGINIRGVGHREGRRFGPKGWGGGRVLREWTASLLGRGQRAPSPPARGPGSPVSSPAGDRIWNLQQPETSRVTPEIQSNTPFVRPRVDIKHRLPPPVCTESRWLALTQHRRVSCSRHSQRASGSVLPACWRLITRGNGIDYGRFLLLIYFLYFVCCRRILTTV